MNAERIYLSTLRVPLQRSLDVYANLISPEISFGDFPEFALTPNKPNSARTLVPVIYAGNQVGDMYVIMFLHKDGTGDQNTYRINEVTIPDEFMNREKPERVIPRAKTGILAEGFFPLFSVKPSAGISYFAAHLAELTLNEKRRIMPLFQLGQSRTAYLKGIRSGLDARPNIELTTGMDASGVRFGDPHSVYNNIQVYNTFQVVGFLPIKDPANPLMELAKNWKKPSKIITKF